MLRLQNHAMQVRQGKARGSEKKRRRKAGVKSLRQVSYRQETYRAVTLV